MERSRLSLNQYTVRPWSLREAVEGCARREIPSIAVWRDKLAEIGLAAAVKAIGDAGLRVSSVCRGGFFPDPDARVRAERVEQTRRAIDEAAALGAPTLVLVCGPAAEQSLGDARAQVQEGIAACTGDAAAAGVRLGIEPLHPMMVAERSVICSFGEANDLCAAIGHPAVGVVCDVYHVFWDVRVFEEIARGGDALVGLHLSDWTTPRGDVTADRAMIGNGCIDLPALARAASFAGYAGDAEIEILNERAWGGDLDAWLDLAVERYALI